MPFKLLPMVPVYCVTYAPGLYPVDRVRGVDGGEQKDEGLKGLPILRNSGALKPLWPSREGQAIDRWSEDPGASEEFTRISQQPTANSQ